MKINLITKDQYNRLNSIYENNQELLFNNNGYEYIDKSKLSENNKQAIKEVESILKNHIIGFSKFNNFRLINNEIQLRFQYNYEAECNKDYFIGVGYIYLTELLNGFKN